MLLFWRVVMGIFVLLFVTTRDENPSCPCSFMTRDENLCVVVHDDL